MIEPGIGAPYSEADLESWIDIQAEGAKECPPDEEEAQREEELAATNPWDEWEDVPEDYRAEVYADIPHEPEDLTSIDLDRIAAEKLLKRYHRLSIEEREAVQFVDDEIARAKEHMEALVARRAELLKPIERKRAWLDTFKGLLESWARQALAGQKARSIKLTYGAVRFRKGPDRLEVTNEPDAIAWSRNNAADAIEVRVKKGVLKDHLRITGEVPYGCELVPGEDTFTVEIAE